MIVHVNHTSEVADARRTATRLAEGLRFDETAVGKAALIATELATNLVKHGGGGAILFIPDHSLTLIAIDRGRGIPNVDAALRDGYSTAGSPGTGLGAITRAADLVDVYTFAGQGSAVLCRIGPTPATALRIGGVSVAKPGEDVAGDAWVSYMTRDTATIAVIDGLGHGPLAATAANVAVRTIGGDSDAPLERILADMHNAMRPTRGAAVGIARIHSSHGRLDFAGVGNIAGGAVGEDATRRVVSLPGIVGHEMRKVQTFSYPFNESTLLILHSDGISSGWNMAAYPGLVQHDPALIAAVLYRDHGRNTDDATVVVIKAA